MFNKNVKVAVLFIVMASAALSLPFFVLTPNVQSDNLSSRILDLFYLSIPLLLFIVIYYLILPDEIDQSADLVYFLGFLTTLGTIASVLRIPFDNNSRNYVFSFFGIGLLITGGSIIARMAIIQFYGKSDPEEDILDKISTVSINLSQFAENIENSIGIFNQAHTQIATTLLLISKDYEDLRSNIKNTTSSISTAMDGLFQSVETSFDSIDLTQLKQKIDAFVSSIERAYSPQAVQGITISLATLDSSFKSVSNSLDNLDRVLLENTSSMPHRFASIDFEETMQVVKKKLFESIDIFAINIRNEEVSALVRQEITESLSNFKRSLDIHIPAEDMKVQMKGIGSAMAKVKDTLGEFAIIHNDIMNSVPKNSIDLMTEASSTKDTETLSSIESKLSEILIQMNKTRDKFIKTSPLDDRRSNNLSTELPSILSASIDAKLDHLNEIKFQLNEINKTIRSFTILGIPDIKIEKKKWRTRIREFINAPKS